MNFSGTNRIRSGSSWIGILLFAVTMLLVTAAPARAQSSLSCIADFGGVLDGNVNPVVPPAHLLIDGNCTIRNYPASNPFTSNVSFFGGSGPYLVIFDNVVFTGNMSCNAVQGYSLWFTNGSTSTLKAGCQNLLIPVEKINKQNPAGQTTATIGVPFTYTLTIPVLFDPATGTVINSSGSANSLHGITVTDDLNATGASLSYVSHTITWRDDGTSVPHTFSNVGGFLTFDNFPIVNAGRQFVIALTVVLNNTPANVPGKQFINTAKWDFGRLIQGVFYEPLPGEWGVTPPMTIAAPVLTVTKSGPATMNLGQWGDFAINAQNTGLGDAWNVTLRDLLPDGSTGGMCDTTPQILSARVFAADGVTPVPGKGPLNPGSDYSLNYTGAPSCRLDLTMQTAAGRIGPNERLIIRYRTQLDANSQNGVTLTNVAGAIQWFNGDSSNPNRVTYTRTLTNGTVGTLDHEDAHTVTVSLTGYFFEKTVANLNSGANPAKTAVPGDILRYTLRFQTTGQPLNNFRIHDELDALNAPPAFAPGTLMLVAYPPGADISATSSTGGTNGTGVVDIRGLSLPANSELLIQFDIILKSALANGTVVTDQSEARLASGTLVGLSDDPTVNGTADPAVSGDEDRTRVTIESTPAFRILKISTDMTGDPNVLLAGETLRYTLTVRNIGTEDATNVVLRDSVPANTTYVAGSTTLNGAAVADVAGLSPLVTGMQIQSAANPSGAMPADASTATITFDVVVIPTTPDGTVISNQGFVSVVDRGIVDQPSDDPFTPIPNDPTRDIVGNLPLLYAEKRVALSVDLGSAGIVDPGDTLHYKITVNNSGAIAATGVVLRDAVPANTTYVANSTLLNGSPFGQPDGGVSPLASSVNTGTLSPGGTSILEFDLRVNPGTPAGTLISNQAVVDTVELPDLLTDGDGNPATGPEPTVVVVGASQQLSITKQVTVVGGGAALPGAVVEYVVRVTNIALVPAPSVVITDDLGASAPGQLTYVGGSATMNSSAAGVTFSGSTITADYAAVNGPLGPGAIVLLRFRAVLAPGLATGTVVTNTGVVAWNNPTQTASASVSLVVGSIPGTLPTLYAEKRVVLSVDLGSPGIVDPGDTLRYTITTENSGTNAATGVILRDTVPANTTYVANSTLLNGSPVGQPDGGVSPLASGINAGTIPPGTTSTLQFDLRVNAGTPAGTLISNQAVVDSVELPDLRTDGDGNRATGPEPTVIVVGVGQQLSITKQVSVVGGGAALPGATFEYIVNVTNIAALPATNVVITDDLGASAPGQLAYVSGSATMNGSTSGVTFSGSTITANYAALIGQLGPGASVVLRFRAVLAPGLATGTAVTNTGVVAWNNPTQTASASVSTFVGSIPGTLPTLYAEKRVVLFVDLGSPGIVDPGDTLRYTITTENSGTNAATGVILRDSVPANTTYVANSTLLNGSPVGQPDGGVSPLASGISAGTIPPGTTSTLQFDLRVNAGTPAGTLISNQAVVDSVELPDLRTDGDGNRTTGPEPTVIVVGVGQQLSITKQVTVVGGGAALPGSTFEYVVNVTNIAALPATNVVITDDIGASAPGQLAYVGGSATMNGSTSGVTFSGSTITANYAALIGTLAPGAGVVLRFRAVLDPGLATGTVVTNTGVVAWNNPTQTASASVSIVVGSLPGYSVLNGSAWHDADLDDVRDATERSLAGWTVELYRNNQLWNSVLTDANGAYRFILVEPNDVTGVPYELRFRAPGEGANTAMLGRTASPFTNGMQRITNLVVPSGANLQGLNLPIHPNGVVFNTLTRAPVVGATLSLLSAGNSSPLPASCFDDAAQQGQITLVDGYYKFDINFSDPACPSGADYLIGVTPPPGTSYAAGYSQIIPATSGPSTAAFSVPSCPASPSDAIPSTAMFCEVQTSEFAPASSIAPRSAGTVYYVHLRLEGSQMPGTSQIFNNHIPLDPQLLGSVAISKTTPLLNVTRGQLVPYVITVNNIAGMMLTDVSIVDRFPAGLSYVEGSALLDGSPASASVVSGELRLNGLSMAGAQVRTVKLLLVVGAGVTDGEYVNHALVVNGTSGGAMSGDATATVRVMPDPTFDCTDVTGKVFNDANRNGVQDTGEDGLPGVRVVTARGLQATTDQYGRYHITCAATPNESRGSNFALKLDDRTLPSGFRLSTDQVQIKRVTRGKDVKFNFAASIQRVVGIDLSDAAFEPGKTEIRIQWRPRLDLLLEELRKGPAVLRLSYIADIEDAALVERRVEAIKRQLTQAWNAKTSGYVLTVEPEVFWRRGAPPKRPDVPKSR